MTAETLERQTVIHIHLPGDDQVKQRSFSQKEMRKICRLDNRAYWSLSHGEFADFWRADNHKETIHEPGKRGRKKRPDPRFDIEHVDYMVRVVNGLLTEPEASDLWSMRKKMIKGELTSRALPLRTNAKRSSKK